MNCEPKCLIGSFGSCTGKPGSTIPNCLVFSALFAKELLASNAITIMYTECIADFLQYSD